MPHTYKTIEEELRAPKNEFPSYLLDLCKRAADEIEEQKRLLSGMPNRDNKPDDESMFSSP